MQRIAIAIDGSSSMNQIDRDTIVEALQTFTKPKDKHIIYIPFNESCRSTDDLTYALNIYDNIIGGTCLLPVLQTASLHKCTEVIVVSDGAFEDIGNVSNCILEYVTGMQRGVVPEYIINTIKKLHYIFLSDQYASDFVELFTTIGNSKEKAIEQYRTVFNSIKRSHSLLISLALWSGGEVSNIPKANTSTMASVKEMLDKICNKPRIKSIF